MNLNQGYIGRSPGDSSVTIARQSYNVTGVTTDFTFASSYTPTLFEVYVNGAKLVNITDYAATDGNTFSLITAAQDGDVVEAVAYKAFNLTTVSNAAGNFSVGGNLTVTGSATVGGVGVVTAGSDASGLTGIVTSLSAGSNISLSGSTGAVTITGLADTSRVVADSLVVSGLTTTTNEIEIRSSDGTPARVDLYCEVSNAHYSRVQAPPHSEFSGNVTSILPTKSGDIIVGDTDGAVTQNINTTGVVTATSFVGSGANLTNLNIPAGFNELDAALFN